MADPHLPSDDPLLGAVLDGKYRLDARLGEGGMGIVYKATQLALQRAVAVKVLTHSAVLRHDLQERFRREALAIARLNHPNIVTIHDFGSVPQFGPYFVMELLEGSTLALEIERRGALPIDLALSLMADVCAGVAYAHGFGIVHRDLKPGNVVLEREGAVGWRAKVLDFGVAWFQGASADTRMTASDAIIGTPQYMAPEQSEGLPVDERTDVYALGCILHEILTGEPLFRARTPMAVLYKHVTEPAPPPSRTAPHVTADLDAAVLRALAKDPADRYASVGEMSAALSAVRCPAPARTSVDTDVAATQTVDGGQRTSDLGLPNNLPHELTSFVGREREITDILRDVKDHRLVTLTGPGGIGKTRFALRTAARAAKHADNPDGVWFVDLSPLTDAALVAQTIAETLGIQEPRDGDVAGALRAELASKRTLLVLDNCEHVVAATAALVGSLLARCSALRVLATSRELLGVAGEVVRPVAPLEIPNAAAGTIADLSRVASVRLFLDRVALANARFALTDANAPAVARLCSLLEGVPLAIELAASRMKVLSVSQIVDRLDSRLRVLADGGRAPEPRHGSLRATIDWSYDLLTDEERAVLRRLGVFAGGGTVDAAEAVCPSSFVLRPLSEGEEQRTKDEGRRTVDVLDVLMRLVEKSLLVAEESDGQMRYRMLEAIREYAIERLAEAGEETDTRDRHARWALKLARDAQTRFMGPDEVAVIAALEREHDNLRVALRWSLTRGEHGIALGLCGALGRFWSVRSHLTEACAWIREALAAAADAPAEPRAGALYAFAQVAVHQGDFTRVREALEEAVPLCRAAGNPRLSALVSRELGVIEIRQGDYAKAESLLEESLAAFVELDDDHGRSLALAALGLLEMDRGDFERAEAWTQECLARARALGNVRGTAVALYNLGVIAGRRQDPAAAMRYYEQSCEGAERLGDAFFIAHVVQGMGSAALDLGDVALAEAHYARALRLDLELNDRDHGAWTLWGFADAAVWAGRMERALRLIGTALALWDSIHSSLPPPVRSDFERKLAEAKAAVGLETAERLLAEGRAETFAEAAAFALGERGRGFDEE